MCGRSFACDAVFRFLNADSVIIRYAWRQDTGAFGRTARINGTEGTDHGTGTVALLAGGALKGGRVIADWPGLKPSNLHEGRDLQAGRSRARR